MEDEDIASNTYVQLIQSIWAESSACTLCWNIVLARLSSHSNWISCLHLAQYPRLPFCILSYKQLIILSMPATLPIKYFRCTFLGPKSLDFQGSIFINSYNLLCFHGPLIYPIHSSIYSSLRVGRIWGLKTVPISAGHRSVITINAMLFLKMRVVIFFTGIKKIAIYMKNPESYPIKCFAQVKKIPTHIFQKRALHW